MSEKRMTMQKLTMIEVLELEGELHTIDGYPDCYVAPSGNVYARSAITPDKLYRVSQSLRAHLPSVNLPSSGKHPYYPEFTHYLVAAAYLPPPPYPGAHLKFKDGNRHNCAVSNLTWHFNPNRRRKGFRILKPGDVKMIKERLKAGETGNSLASEYGVDKSMISRIKSGKRHSDKP